MKLCHSPGACSLAVHIALREAGQRFDLAQVDLATHRLADASDYLAINPRGYVPLLELDDGARHGEAAALLQYVGDLDASGALLPAAGLDRLAVVEWLGFVATELHKVFSPWLWQAQTADSTAQACRNKLARCLAPDRTSRRTTSRSSMRRTHRCFATSTASIASPTSGYSRVRRRFATGAPRWRCGRRWAAPSAGITRSG